MEEKPTQSREWESKLSHNKGNKVGIVEIF